MQMIAAVRIPRASLSDPDRHISVAAVCRLLEQSAELSGVHDFGLRLAECRTLSNFGPLGLAVKEQPTVRAALETLVRYFRLHNEALLLGIDQSREDAVLNVRFIGIAPTAVRQAIQLSIGVFYRVVRALVPHAAQGVSAWFAHSAPSDKTMYRRIFGSRVGFDCRCNGVRFNAGDMAALMPTSDNVLAEYARKYLDSIASPSRATISDRVHSLAYALLPSGRCSAERVADHLGVNRRTLHRRLAQENRTYLRILTEIRREVAQRQLATRERSLGEVAEMLGFSTLGAFSRWFRLEFGRTASRWREVH
jgi:AraC-like DNA-binding protein